MLGGRIAESTRHENLTTGAYDDLQRATKMAITQFLALGMSARVGLLAFDYNRLDSGRMYQTCSEATQRMAEKEAQAIVAAAFEFTSAVLKEREADLHKVADSLMLNKEVLREELETILGKRNTDVASIDPRATAALARFVKHAESEGSKDMAADSMRKLKAAHRDEDPNGIIEEKEDLPHLAKGLPVDQTMA
jgi:hypothetical protein